MNPFSLNLVLILFILIFSLNSSRLKVLVHAIAALGILVSTVPLFLDKEISTITSIFVIITSGVKGVLIPILLLRVLKKVIKKKEIEPIIGYHASIFASIFIMVISIMVGTKIHFPVGGFLLGTTAIATILNGMFLLVSRRKMVTQVIGYLMMENGIYLVGLTLIHRSRHIVEFGILLDILVGVMIMVVILQQINLTFNNVNTTKIRNLKE